MNQKWKILGGVLHTNGSFEDRSHYEPCRCPMCKDVPQYSMAPTGMDMHCNAKCPHFELSKETGEPQYVILHCGMSDSKDTAGNPIMLTERHEIEGTIT